MWNINTPTAIRFTPYMARCDKVDNISRFRWLNDCALCLKLCDCHIRANDPERLTDITYAVRVRSAYYWGLYSIEAKLWFSILRRIVKNHSCNKWLRRRRQTCYLLKLNWFPLSRRLPHPQRPRQNRTIAAAVTATLLWIVVSNQPHKVCS